MQITPIFKKTNQTFYYFEKECLFPNLNPTSYLKYLTVLLVPLKFLLCKKDHFCLFQSVSSLNLLWCQMYTFYCDLRNKRCTVLHEGTNVYIKQHIHQKDLNFCLSLYYYAKVIDLKTEKQDCKIIPLSLVLSM